MPIYSNGVDNRLMEQDFPLIASAVKVIRERLDFRGFIEIKALRKGRGGEYNRGVGVIRIGSHIEQRDFMYAIEIVVHEAIHALGIHHEENFRSHGGRRCIHGYDALSHLVTSIIIGKDTFANMKFLHTHVGAFSKKLLRQIARVEAILLVQRGITDALGGCDIADLTDARMYKWAQMTPQQKAAQQAKMQIGRLKRLGYSFDNEVETIQREAELLEAKYR